MYSTILEDICKASSDLAKTGPVTVKTVCGPKTSLPCNKFSVHRQLWVDTAPSRAGTHLLPLPLRVLSYHK